jgi:hypothetical protein
MNWIKFFKYSRHISLFLFAILYVCKKFGIIENFELFKNVYLLDLSSLFVLLYLVFYLRESRLEINEKDAEISVLKSQLK